MNAKICRICKRNTLLFWLRIDSSSILKCEYCKVARTFPMPSRKSLQDFYSSFSYESGFINESLIRSESVSILKTLDKHKGKLLDIGSGAGFLLDEAKKRGWEVTGIEMSKKLANYGAKNFKLNIINGDFLTIKLPEESFDAIVLSQVIEHLTDPERWLSRIKKLIKKDGVFALTTPNIESHLFNVQRESFPYLIPPEHVFYYGPTSLRMLLNRCGFKKATFKTYGYPVDMAGIIKRIIKGKSAAPISRTARQLVNQEQSLSKKIKYILFDTVLCGWTYKLLNIGNKGSIVEVYASIN